MKQRLAPFLTLLEARYAPLLFAVAPQAFAVFLWLWQGSDGRDEAWVFAIVGALGFEFIYIGAIAWADSGQSSRWTRATAFFALAFSVAVAIYVYRDQGIWAVLHAGFPLVAWSYTMAMHGPRVVSRDYDEPREDVAWEDERVGYLIEELNEARAMIASLENDHERDRAARGKARGSGLPTRAALVKDVREAMANHRSLAEVARETGFPEATLRGWVAKAWKRAAIENWKYIKRIADQESH